jgi:predicted DNA-binding antitoxin AbrB/MazE fold protein
MTVQAVFENGVFRPTGQVAIPEHCVVEFEPRIVSAPTGEASFRSVYDILDRRFESGETDVAARHDDHQP